ncbi:VCBS repeat-containing protein [Alteromonas sp. 1_MG-2023]|uniref:FG-GAP repeat domain-containing protein n=1 Tax=Alteromonas sp. 1_MG-2023 TaxID=3062669 RepID=UPI0026E38FA5|nr:VCBS repeat-containing protein [Alteromonas sp. 1_MG-2023]MDO6568486.1 VCBS repeat-containing protein [Alteromonas sp. 1_MG-2023]
MIKMSVAIYFLSMFECLVSAYALADTIEIDSIKYTSSIIETGAGQPTIIASDINADDYQDVIIANASDNNIITYLSDGKGTLNRGGSFAAGDSPSGLAISNINADGHVDVVVANHETSYITLLFGRGDGTFVEPSHSPLNINVKPHPHVVKLSDLDGDETPDLIVDNRNHHGLLVLKGLSKGGFKTPGTVIDAGGDPYRGFAVGDINNDGFEDMVTPNQRDIGVLLNTGDKQMRFSLSKLVLSESPFVIELADMNGDGNHDVIVATNGSVITIMLGDGRGNFLKAAKSEINASTGAKQIATCDINGDGIDDALISSWSGEVLAILGSKSSFDAINFKHPQIQNPWSLAILDINQDGKSDFVIGDGDSKRAAVYVSVIEL